MTKRRRLPLPVGDRRNCPVTCKVSPADLAVIIDKAKAAGKTISSYLRDAAVCGVVEVRQAIPPINAEQWRELSKVAANLNQIAHHCNSGSEYTGSSRVLKAVEETLQQLAEVRSALLRTKGVPPE